MSRDFYFINRDEENFAAGFGIEFPTGSTSRMRVDYAFSAMDILDDTHKFSAELKF